MDQNMEQVALQLVEGMKRKGTQTQTIRIGNQIIKIQVESEIVDDNSIQLSDIDHNESGSQSFSKDSLLKQETSKKISLLCSNTEESEPPNSFINGLFFDEEFEQDQQEFNDNIQKENEDITEHLNNFFNSHPESKTRFESLLQRVEELENQKNQLKKKEEELSHYLSTSLNGSQNIFDTSSHLFSLQKIASDPLCKLVSTHFKNFQGSTLIQTTEKPSILFLYSQPLVHYVNGVQKAFPMLIDYEKEQSNIRNILSQCKVGYIRENASIEKLANWLQTGVEFIHFSGHGVKGNDENLNSDYLVFEDSDGGSYNLSTKELKEILKKMKKSLKFVFVASCHSKQIGEVFLSAGVQHVICVRREEKILDEACQQFVKNFYISCFNNNQTVCSAFEFAKLQVSYLGFPKGEEHKFVMLTSKSDGDDHTCNHYVLQKYGQFKDLTSCPKYSLSIPCKVENFIARPKIMADVISALSKSRFITLKGIPGIGKSTLGREIIRYISFRNKFKDGVIYIQLLGCDNIEGFFHHLYGIFEGNSLKYKTSCSENIDRITNELKSKNTLIYIDNCDTIFGSDHKTEFRTTIESILQNCPFVHFLFTSRNRLGEFFNSYEIDSCSERVITVDKLDSDDAKRLFLYKVPNPAEITQEKITEFIKIAKVPDLALHPIFEFLNGHPQAICMSAALLDGRSLKQLYQLLVNRNYVDVLSNDDKKGYNAFRISLEVSWNIIQKRASESSNGGEKEAAQMFRIMGMLPSGLDKETMPKIFGTKWRESVKILQKYSLLKQTDKVGHKYYSIYSHMIPFAESKLDKDTKNLYHQKICEELQRRVFEKIYKHVGTGSPFSEGAAQLFFYQQNNYKACIFREYEKIGYPERLKQFYSNLLNEDYEDSDLSETHSITSSRSSKSKFNLDSKKKNLQDDNLSQSSIDQKKPLRYKQASKSKSPFKDTESLAKMNLSAYMMMKRRNPPSILRLILFQATVLFILKNFPACEKIVAYGRDLAERMKNPLAQANLIRVLACIQLYKRNQGKARDQFGKALELFANIGCGLGVASCEAALGYIQHIEQQFAQAKKNLQNALKYYDQIPHIFGKHYLNRWLLNIKTKINRGQNELKTHNQQALKLLKDTKLALKGNKIDSFQLKHKAGFFVFRFMFDNISLFLQSAFQIDVRPTKRTTANSKTDHATILYKPLIYPQPFKKLILQNDLLPVAQVKQQQKSFIQSQTKIKIVNKGEKNQFSNIQMRDIHKKKMMKSIVLKEAVKDLKESSASKEMPIRVRTESQHGGKKDWK